RASVGTKSKAPSKNACLSIDGLLGGSTLLATQRRRTISAGSMEDDANLSRQAGQTRETLARQAVVHGDNLGGERQRDAALRPRWLREVIGQRAVVQRLGIALNACKKLKEPLSHILFDGPPGLGKTTFATVLPNELGTAIQMTSGPALTNPKDLL